MPARVSDTGRPDRTALSLTTAPLMKLRHTIFLPLLLFLLPALSLRADRTLRGKLRPATTAGTGKQTNTNTAIFDTIVSPTSEKVRLNGYDKPLNSRLESLFVTNSLKSDIIALKITLTYTDLRGRTLHKTTRLVKTDIPVGSTRRIQFQSWDTQNSFYYRHSRRPRTANVTPYDVSCQVDTCITIRLSPDLSTPQTSDTTTLKEKK